MRKILWWVDYEDMGRRLNITVSRSFAKCFWILAAWMDSCKQEPSSSSSCVSTKPRVTPKAITPANTITANWIAKWWGGMNTRSIWRVMWRGNCIQWWEQGTPFCASNEHKVRWKLCWWIFKTQKGLSFMLFLLIILLAFNTQYLPIWRRTHGGPLVLDSALTSHHLQLATWLSKVCERISQEQKLSWLQVFLPKPFHFLISPEEPSHTPTERSWRGRRLLI